MDKKYYSGSVAVTTWRSRKTFVCDNVTSNHRADLITFREGVWVNIVVDPNHNISEKLSLDARKKYTKEEIAEAITSAWDKGEYADDQTDINWLFNPDPEGFTGTVDLATVLLKDRYGYRGSFEAYHNPQVRARCRVSIVDGAFFEKLDGSSKLADILKHHKGVFATKEDVEKYIKDKWFALDFGNDASYYALEIEED